MTTLTDYLPHVPHLQLNAFQEVLWVAWFVIFFSWVVVSTVVVLAKGWSLFSDDPKCSTFIKLTRKYSPPAWRMVTSWILRFEIVLLILFLVSLFVWHEKLPG
jgi:hypothetical protein